MKARYCAGFKVTKGNNALRAGSGAVASRLENKGLRVCDGCCPNLLAEAELYRYATPDEEGAEKPADEHNHALAALRYLIARIDAHKMARPWWKRKPAVLTPP